MPTVGLTWRDELIYNNELFYNNTSDGASHSPPFLENMISIFTEGIGQKPQKGNTPPPSLAKSGKEDGGLITEY